jgi:RNA polymerase-binding transcription factor DksA
MAKKTAPKKAAKPVKKVAKPAPKKVAKAAAKKPVKQKPKPAAKKAAPKKVAKVASKAKKAVKAAPKKAVKAVPSKAKKAAPAASKAKKAAPKKAVKVAKAAPKAKPTTKAGKAVSPKKTEKKVVAKVAKTPPVKTPPAKPVKKESKKKKKASTPKESKVASAKPLVTQRVAPNRPMPAPVVKKQVSTLERADKLRYTDEELVEFTTLIKRKLDEARKDYDLLKQTLANTDNNGTDDTSPSFKMIEDGSETLSREETAQLAGRQEKFIKHLEDALLRIRNKTYGICRVTGRLISKERLRLVPHATLSIEAKQQMGN